MGAVIELRPRAVERKKGRHCLPAPVTAEEFDLMQLIDEAYTEFVPVYANYLRLCDRYRISLGLKPILEGSP